MGPVIGLHSGRYRCPKRTHRRITTALDQSGVCAHKSLLLLETGFFLSLFLLERWANRNPGKGSDSDWG